MEKSKVFRSFALTAILTGSILLAACGQTARKRKPRYIAESAIAGDSCKDCAPKARGGVRKFYPRPYERNEPDGGRGKPKS